MGDPFSLSLGIFAVLRVAKSLVSYIDAIKGRSHAREKLRDELISTIGVLYMLKDHIDSADIDDNRRTAASFLGNPRGPVKQLRISLEEFTSKLTPGMHRVGRVIGALSWPHSEKDISKILLTIERQKSCFNLALHNDHMYYGQSFSPLLLLLKSGSAISRAIQAQVSDVSNNMVEMKEIMSKLQIGHQSVLEDNEAQKIFAWLSPFDFAIQQRDHFAKFQEGTGQWLLDSEEFQSWLSGGPKKTLYCPGIPGAGKSVLASIVINHLQATLDPEDSVVAYLFCSYLRTDQNPVSLLGDMLKQVLKQGTTIPVEIRQLYRTYKKDQEAATMQAVRQMFNVYFSTSRTLYVVVDALDECPDGLAERQALLSELASFQKKYSWHILATSRDVPGIMTTFKEAVRLEIRASDADIARYLDGQMFRMPACVMTREDLKDDIKKEIADAADGMFLLASLHFDALADKNSTHPSPKGVRLALKDVKKKENALGLAYDAVLGRITGLAMEVISWVSNACEPMSVDELLHAIATESGEANLDEENLIDAQDLISGCAGLVKIELASNIVKFVHETTSNYFESKKRLLFPTGPFDILTKCITYLSFEPFADACGVFETRELMSKYSFLRHAALHWVNYFNACHDKHDGDLIVARFLSRKSNIFLCQIWRSPYPYKFNMPIPEQGDFRYPFHQRARSLFRHRRYHDECNPIPGLHMAAALGRVEVVSTLLANGHNVNVMDMTGDLAICAALANDNGKVVLLLLEKGAMIRAIDLESAIRGNNFAMFERLAGVIPVDDIRQACNQREQSLLYTAATLGRVEMAEYLIKLGANVNHKTYHPYYALAAAANLGYTEMVSLLLKNGANATLGEREWTHDPLFNAVMHGHKDIATVLVEHGAAANVCAGYREPGFLDESANLWQNLIDWGDEALVKLILSKRTPTQKAEGRVGRAFECAVLSRNLAMTQLLLDEGADANSFRRSGRVLHEAVERGNLDVVMTWLKHGADVEILADDGSGKTALHKAAAEGSVEILQIIIQSGADMEKRTKDDQTPLLLAAYRSRNATFEALIAAGANIKATVNSYTALHLAADNGDDLIANLALKNGVDMNAQLKDGETALDLAIKKGHERVVDLLLRNGARKRTFWRGPSIAKRASEKCLGSATRVQRRPSL